LDYSTEDYKVVMRLGLGFFHPLPLPIREPVIVSFLNQLIKKLDRDYSIVYSS